MNNSFKVIAENMRNAIGVKTLQDLAIALEISPQTLSSHKKSGRFPEKHILKFSKKYAVPVEFLMTGEVPGARKMVDQEIKRLGFGSPPDPVKKYLLNLGRIIKWLDSGVNEKETIGENAKAISKELKGVCTDLIDESKALVAKFEESYGLTKDEKIIMLLEKEVARLEAEKQQMVEKIKLLENR